jgi:hypothetical protein
LGIIYLIFGKKFLQGSIDQSFKFFFYLGVAKEYQKKNQIVAPHTNILVNPVSPDSTETNSARDIHHMLTRQEASQSRFAPEIAEIGNDGQSEENHPSIYYNHHNNTGDAELMPTLERVVDYPPQLKSQQMICVNIIGLLFVLCLIILCRRIHLCGILHQSWNFINQWLSPIPLVRTLSGFCNLFVYLKWKT